MNQNLKKALPHLVVILLFIIAALAYFSPVLQGKTVYQSDIVQYQGMAKQLKDYRAKTGEETFWTDSAFGGMPTYQLGAKYPYNLIKELDLALRFLPRPADYLFLYFAGIYLLLLVLRLDFKLAFLGALAFGFSTYLIIILGVGHNAKAHAIAYMPLVLSGILLTFRGRYIWGFVLTCIAMALELVANHFQMTYYLLFLVVCIGVAYAIDAFRKKILPHYFKSVGILLLAVLLAVGLNATNILATKEYADTSTRGTSELSITPDGTVKERADGLDYDYITEYSYGLAESFNLFIPRFMGGGSSEALPIDGETSETLLKMGVSPQEASQILNQLPVYWGDQPIVAAPAYIGAVVVFLAVLALFLVHGRLKWWLVSAFLLSLLLSWGRNFSVLTNFFIEYIPLYNKFRAVSSIQVIIELVIPILAVFGLHQFFNGFISEEKKKKALLYAVSITGGFSLLLLLFASSLLDFANPLYDSMIREQLGNPLVEAVRDDRAALLRADTLRSLVFVILSTGVLGAYFYKRMRESVAVVAFALLIVVDLVGVDRRYVNNEDFVSAKIMEEPFQIGPADEQILKDDGTFRVYDATTNAFSSGRASYFYNALGGYHAAKPGRMQELYDFYISQGHIGMLNMLNVKYILVRGKSGGVTAQRNPYNNGNAWFVEEVVIAENADEEMLALDSLDTKKVAVVHQEFKEALPKSLKADSTATVDLISHSPGHIVYEVATKSPQLLVFSEVYYPNGWNAYINGKAAHHYRANYVLRAMTVPEGNNKIEFKFEPKVIQTGSSISLGSALMLLLIIAGGVYVSFKRKKNSATATDR
jgi:LPXTG-motif cell wall-anchored protein